MNARTLEVGGIVRTAERLAERVDDRFRDRGINRLVADLVSLSRETERRLTRSRQPRWVLRVLIGTVIVVGIVTVVLAAKGAELGWDVDGLDEWLELLQNGIQDVVFIGIAVAFLVTIESRLERRDTLAALHELRSVAHVIDMHQLTKDPDTVLHADQRTEHSPDRSMDAFLVSRYLDYCSEMLALTSKLAALYAQESTDQAVLAAVREIEDLTGTLSNKIWQKIMVLDLLEDQPGVGSGGGKRPTPPL